MYATYLIRTPLLSCNTRFGCDTFYLADVMGCAPAAGSRNLSFLSLHLMTFFYSKYNFEVFPVLRAPPVPAFYDYIKSVGGGTVHKRPFNVSKRSLLLYDDDTTMDFEQVF
jgi:hypothetical protein